MTNKANETQAIEITSGNKASTLMRLASKNKVDIQVEGLFERGAIVLIVAPAKAKKTMLATNLALSLLTKKPFLGHAVSPAKEKILYANLELTRIAFGSRLLKMDQHYNFKPMSDDLIVLDRQQLTNGGDLVNAKDRKVESHLFDALIQTIQDEHITTVIIDPLYIVVGEENDNVLMTAVCREFEKIRTQTSATVIIVHHTGKGMVDWEEPFLAGRGASSLGGAVECVLGIQPKADRKSAIIHHGARNLESVEPFTIFFNSETLTWDTATAVSPDKQLDLLMGTNDELPIVQICEESGMKPRVVNSLIKKAKCYVHIKSKKGQQSVVARTTKPKPV